MVLKEFSVNFHGKMFFIQSTIQIGKLLNSILLFSILYPKTPPPPSPHWVTDDIKRMITSQHRLYNNVKKYGYRADDKIRVDNFLEECNNAILAAKEKFLCELGGKLSNPTTGQKLYWKVINQLLNKCKAPINNKIVKNCNEKTVASQCSPLINNSTLPTLSYSKSPGL